MSVILIFKPFNINKRIPTLDNLVHPEDWMLVSGVPLFIQRFINEPCLLCLLVVIGVVSKGEKVVRGGWWLWLLVQPVNWKLNMAFRMI